MTIVSKGIKIKRLKKIVSNSNFFILCNDSSMPVDLYIKLKQSLLKLNLNCCKVNNRLMRVVLKDSILNFNPKKILGHNTHEIGFYFSIIYFSIYISI